MEHSVCKVSLAHHTKEWLSALFEALEGLELSVNNYLFTLLWIACRNKRLSHHLYQRSPSTSLLATTHSSCWERRNGRTVSLYNVSFVHEERPISCHNSASLIRTDSSSVSFTIWRAAQTAQLRALSTSSQRGFIILYLEQFLKVFFLKQAPSM